MESPARGVMFVYILNEALTLSISFTVNFFLSAVIFTGEGVGGNNFIEYLCGWTNLPDVQQHQRATKY